MSEFTLFAGRNSHVVSLTQLTRGVPGDIISDAVVKLESLKDEGGNDVTGVTWPLVMPPVIDTPGAYEAEIPPGADINGGNRYKGTFTAVAPGGHEGEWVKITTARIRTGC